MAYPYILSFKNSVSLKDEGVEGVALIFPSGKLKLKDISPGMREFYQYYQTTVIRKTVFTMFLRRGTAVDISRSFSIPSINLRTGG